MSPESNVTLPRYQGPDPRKRDLGHRSIQSTMLYTQLITFKEDSYVFKVVKALKEAAELIEAGF
ncbi:MAG: hypothetical protein QXR42_05665 [Candidatus Bathyarchaeia archaeon]